MLTQFEIDYNELEIEANFLCELNIATDFAETLPESASAEDLDRVAVPIIRYLISSGERGYKDPIDEITDDAGNPPSADNNWLWDETLPGFKGRFIDRRDEGDMISSFEIVQNGETWDRNFMAAN